MRFFAYFGKGAIVTDDYSNLEISKGKHFRNLREDLKRLDLTHCRVYDENNNFIRSLHV